MMLSGLFAAALLSQEPVALWRTFSEGEKQTHAGKMTVVMAGNELELLFKLDQTATKVDAQGEADVAFRMYAIDATFGGQKLPRDAGPRTGEQKWVLRLNGQNKIVAEKEKPSLSLFSQFLSGALFTAMLPGAPIQVGQSYPLDFSFGPSKFKGQSTLAEIKDGQARLQTDLAWTRPGQTKPATVTMAAWVHVKSGRTVKIQGTAKDVQGPSGTGVESIKFELMELEN